MKVRGQLPLKVPQQFFISSLKIPRGGTLQVGQLTLRLTSTSSLQGILVKLIRHLTPLVVAKMDSSETG